MAKIEPIKENNYVILKQVNKEGLLIMLVTYRTSALTPTHPSVGPRSQNKCCILVADPDVNLYSLQGICL